MDGGTTRTGSGWRRPFAAIADVLFILLAGAGIFIELYGGVVWRIGRQLITARSSMRAFVLAGIVLGLRHLLVQHPSIVSRLRAPATWLKALIRPYARALDVVAIAGGLLVVIVDLAGGWPWTWNGEPVDWPVGTVPGVIAGVALAIRLAVSGGARVPGMWTGAGHAAALDFAWPTRREWVAVTLAMALVTAVMLHQQLAAFTSVPDYGDPLFSMWRLTWFAHQIRIDPSKLFDANIFYPDERTFASSDTMLAPSAMAAPALWLGVPATVVYTTMLLLTFVACGVSMYALVRALTGHAAGAFVAGLVFAFDPFRIAHYTHFELLFTFWMPFAMLSILRTLSSGRLRDGVIAGIFVALLALSSLYYAAFFSIALAALVIGWIWTRGWLTRRTTAALTATAVIVVTTAALVTLPHRANRSTVGQRSLYEIGFYSAHGRDYLTAHARNGVYQGTWLADPSTMEHALFPGAGTWVLAGAAFAPPVGALVAPAAIALAVSVDASLGLNGTSYTWLNEWRLIRGFRAPARFRAVVGVFTAILAGIGFARLARRMTSPLMRLPITVVVVVALMFELHPTLKLRPVWPAPPPIYQAIPAGAVIADMPLPSNQEPFWRDMIYMYFSTFHWHPMVNGSSGFIPARYRELGDVAKSFPADPALDALRSLGVEYIVLHEQFYDDRYRTIVAAADKEPRLTFVSVATWSGGEVRLYKVIK